MPTVAEYVIHRLAQLGITECFGVPGDFSFPLNDAIESSGTIRWIGCANELNAAYAADGYARVKGMALLNTTFGVGELSAINGVMGSYSEYCTVFHLVGAPSTRHQKSRQIVHHSPADGNFDRITSISASSACAHALLTPDNCIPEMERIIAAALTHRRPVYIQVPRDVADMPVTAGTVAPWPEPVSDPKELRLAVHAALAKLQAAKTGAILPAFTAARFGIQKELLNLIEASGLPFATTSLDKGVISESHPQYLGMYAGKFSMPDVVRLVEHSDVLINAGGVLFNDFSTGGFAHTIDPSKTIKIDIDATTIDGRVYTPVRMQDIFSALAQQIKKLGPFEAQRPQPRDVVGAPDDPITAASLYPRYQRFFRPGDIILADTGTSSAGVSGLLLPENAVYHNPTLWGAIGWATPAALGTSLADRNRRTILITGEGGHQCTVNDLGAFARYGVKPIIFVLNNSGYTVERALEHNGNWSYNDLVPWNYTQLPATFGCKDWLVRTVRTNGELDTVMQQASIATTACYIEIIADPQDYPQILHLMHDRLGIIYGY